MPKPTNDPTPAADDNQNTNNPTPPADNNNGGDGGNGGGTPQDNDPTTPPDKHGEPTINKGRYDREMKEKNDEIAKLKAELEKSKEGKKTVDDAMAEVAKLREELADKELTHKLDKAGCVNVKAAKAVLDDYEGDVQKLIEGAPYLFGSQQQEPRRGSTGAKPHGTPNNNDDAWMDKAFGL